MQDRSRATTEALMEAISLEVAERGVEGLTVRRVADRAGVAIGAAYQYYASSADLIAAWELREFQRLAQRLGAVIAELLEKNAPLEQSVRTVTLVGIDAYSDIVRHYRTPHKPFSSIQERLALVKSAASTITGVLEQIPDRALLRPTDLAMALRIALSSIAYCVVALEVSSFEQEERAAWRATIAEMIVGFLVKDASYGGSAFPVAGAPDPTSTTSRL
jgi:AcrR family transcriptional regulator